MLLEALDPQVQAIVHAAAGTGKTWLLTSRIVRLLLAGARPSSLLVLTFSRKAATEIEQRVMDRIRALAWMKPHDLDAALAALGLMPDNLLRDRARRLYETMLAQSDRMTISTFHGFCQNLLARFPMQAQQGGALDVLEATQPARADAWALLMGKTESDPDLHAALTTLVETLGSLSRARKAVELFWEQRAGWQAFTRGDDDPVAAACLRLQSLFGDTNGGINAPLHERLQTCAKLLGQTESGQAAAGTITACLEGDVQWRERLIPLFLRDGQVRRIPLTQALCAPHGDLGKRFRAAWPEAGALLQPEDSIRRQRNTLQLSAAWYRCGHVFVSQYEQLLAKHHQIDFTGLELAAAELLQNSEQAHWIQYRLDQRIRHILIDEFQDTSGTQWGLVAPLVEEFAASGMIDCSVFLVGDDKQSLYGFRRASPGLLQELGHWLQQHVGARVFEQDCSRRSAAAIIELVNSAFGADEPLLPSFRPHTTVWQDLWGQIILQPLLTQSDMGPPADAWRDPSVTPRAAGSNQRYHDEACGLVAQIQRYVGTLPLGPEGVPARYGDILILLRDRRAASFYEEALRAARIPYLGTAHADPLESLELRDLLDLMAFLADQTDNRALAGVLRAPLFDLPEEQLLTIARSAHATETSWWCALLAETGASDSDTRLVAIRHCLERWLERVDRIPVHDLLDLILHESDAWAAYSRKAPAHLQIRVRHHLQQFLGAALEFDGGRFPGLVRFREALLHRLQIIEPDQEDQDRVRVMTIHGAKGLEAPIVFLVDTAREAVADRDARPVVDWPPGSPVPRRFHFTGVKRDSDDVSQLLFDQQAQAAAQEDLNALYVGLTRSRQVLVISGCRPRTEPESPTWYQRIEAALAHLGAKPDADSRHIWTTGIAVAAALPPITQQLSTHAPAMTPIARFIETPQNLRPLAIPESRKARTTGQAIHRLLQYRTQGHSTTRACTLAAREFPEFLPTEWRHFEDEVERVLSDKRWSAWFDSRQYDKAHNEISLAYQTPEGAVTGTIDRLVLTARDIVILDYKTHRDVDPATILRIAHEYQPQMQRYVEGVRRLWPRRPCRSYLLFTAVPQLIESAQFSPEN